MEPVCFDDPLNTWLVSTVNRSHQMGTSELRIFGTCYCSGWSSKLGFPEDDPPEVPDAFGLKLEAKQDQTRS